MYINASQKWMHKTSFVESKDERGPQSPIICTFIVSGVARWFVFKPKIPIGVNYEGP
jgi:hypothetical protein